MQPPVQETSLGYGMLWYGMVVFHSLLDTSEVILEMIFTANHLTVAKLGLNQIKLQPRYSKQNLNNSLTKKL